MKTETRFAEMAGTTVEYKDHRHFEAATNITFK